MENGRPNHILSVDQFSTNDLQEIFTTTKDMKEVVERFGGCSSSIFRNQILTCLFYEPSTRTSSSFMAAMYRLGGKVIPINDVEFSSVSKGENLPDTIRTLGQYSDVIVLRHKIKGSAQVAAEYSAVPIINAGDGSGEHPTQALLDLYTIYDEFGLTNLETSMDGLKIAMIGDLKYGRTVHSLTKLLAKYNVSFRFVSPEILRMPMDTMNHVINAGRETRETHNLEDVISTADVIYVTRIQKERFARIEEYEEVKNCYEITPELMKKAKKKMILMHPLPRIDEIHHSVDKDPRAVYFKQVKNGMYVRMALLKSVLCREPETRVVNSCYQ